MHSHQSRPAPAIAPVQPQDLELMRRLHEMRDASSLVLQFGPHKGEPPAQVALHDPDYIRQLTLFAHWRVGVRPQGWMARAG
jgi:hypothetical protein